jgi:hypothetical protein
LALISINVLQEVVRKNFGVFGEVEYIKILRSKGVAFVKYTHRAMAEFAKEAMHEQAMEHGEVSLRTLLGSN